MLEMLEQFGAFIIKLCHRLVMRNYERNIGAQHIG